MPQNQQPMPPPLPFPNSESPHTAATLPPSASPPLHLRLNILQNGKRTLPPCDLPASQCPDLTNARQLLSRKYAGQIPGIPSDPDSISDPTNNAWNVSMGWRFRVWLPEGLISIEHDSDWTLALLAAEKVEWLDGQLKVLVEVEQ